MLRRAGAASNVTLHAAAASDAAGESTFWVVGGGSGDGGGGPGEAASEEDGMTRAPGVASANAVRVPTVTLDDTMGPSQRVLLLKVIASPPITVAPSSVGQLYPSQIDAQGHDASVLRGAKALLAERRAFIVVFEVSPEPNHKLVETLPHSPDHDPNWARCRLASRAT